MKKIIPLFILIFTYFSYSQNQPIVQAEYFVGNDPGEGKGTPINLLDLGSASVKINWKDLPPLKLGEHVYVRIKTEQKTYNTPPYASLPATWSMPMLVHYPMHGSGHGTEKGGGPGYPPISTVYPKSYVLLKAAEAWIYHIGKAPDKINIWATDGKFDNILDSVRTIISKDSLKIGDTLKVRLQNTLDLWSDWIVIPISKETFTTIENDILFNLINLEISPNPANESAIIKLNSLYYNNITLFIKDIKGSTINKVDGNKLMGLGEKNISFSTKDYPAGTYFIQMFFGKETITKKLIVVH